MGKAYVDLENKADDSLDIRNLEILKSEIEKLINWDGSGDYYMRHTVLIQDSLDHGHIMGQHL